MSNESISEADFYLRHEAVNKVNVELDTILATKGKLKYVKILYSYTEKSYVASTTFMGELPENELALLIEELQFAQKLTKDLTEKVISLTETK